MSEEQALLQDFQSSERKKTKIAAVIVALGIAGLIAAKLYQGHVRGEAAASMEALRHGQTVEH